MADEVVGADTISLLDDGQLKFRVRLPDGTEGVQAVDILTLKLFCERKEAEHNLETAEGRLIATDTFMDDLAAGLSELGLTGLTRSQAWKVWVASSDAMVRLKN